MTEKVARPLGTVTRIMSLEEPVLIAPRGRYHHRPVVIITDAGLALGNLPVCGTLGDRYLAVDRIIATLLDRTACSRCWPDGQERLL